MKWTEENKKSNNWLNVTWSKGLELEFLAEWGSSVRGNNQT